ncbi:MAG: low molecular weight phosphatase family protein [Clostridia bacterium]|nr:low molecular weight phosphatase family protein [Clostridia bacterium]
MYKVLFVCSQNMCRSPYCEMMFRRLVEESPVLRDKVEVTRSSAVMTPGTSIDPLTVEALVREGFDKTQVEQHRPGFMYRKADIKLFNEADIVIGMTKSHKYMIFVPSWRRKFKTLSEAATGSYKAVPDPWLQRDTEKYIGEMNKIKAYLEQYIKVLEEELK